MLDEHGIKPLSVLKDNPGFAKINWFSHFRLKTPLEKFSSRDEFTLRSTGVTLASVKTGKTPLNHASLTSTGVTLPAVKTVKHLLIIFRALMRYSKGSPRAPATTEKFCYFINRKAQ